MPDQPLPDPRNAPGDFYVRTECCTGCDYPRAAAPDLFDRGPDGTGKYSCYVRRQPATQQELEQMVSVLEGQEFDCIRYSGSAPAILNRLNQETIRTCCDLPEGDGQ